MLLKDIFAVYILYSLIYMETSFFAFTGSPSLVEHQVTENIDEPV